MSKRQRIDQGPQSMDEKDVDMGEVSSTSAAADGGEGGQGGGGTGGGALAAGSQITTINPQTWLTPYYHIKLHIVRQFFHNLDFVSSEKWVALNYLHPDFWFSGAVGKNIYDTLIDMDNVGVKYGIGSVDLEVRDISRTVLLEGGATTFTQVNTDKANTLMMVTNSFKPQSITVTDSITERSLVRGDDNWDMSGITNKYFNNTIQQIPQHYQKKLKFNFMDPNGAWYLPLIVQGQSDYTMPRYTALNLHPTDHSYVKQANAPLHDANWSNPGVPTTWCGFTAPGASPLIQLAPPDTFGASGAAKYNIRIYMRTSLPVIMRIPYGYESDFKMHARQSLTHPRPTTSTTDTNIYYEYGPGPA